MRLLALDLATTSGFAAGSIKGAEPCEHGNFSCKQSSTDSDGAKFLCFHNWLIRMIRKHKPEKIYFEQVVRTHKSTAAAHIYGGLRSHVLAIAEHYGIECIGINVTTIKSYATGKVNADKKQMIKAAQDLGYLPQCDNAADAIMLFHYAKDIGERPNAA